ncbi:MAG: glycosyltransferase [Bacteroidales bacterium]|nr:glycosyltransferase [Bacteroidales bacterium]
MKKVLLVTEYINPPYDEGIKKTAYNIYTELKKEFNVKVYCRRGLENDPNIDIVHVNRLFYNHKMKSSIKNFNADAIIYLPFSSATFASYLRSKIISSYQKSAKSILIALQPKPIKTWQNKLLKCLFPDVGLTPSPDLKKIWDEKKFNAVLLPLFTDLNKFYPIKNSLKKIKFRKKYNIPENAYVIIHMGHLNSGRNLDFLIPLQKAGNQVVIIGSSSTPHDAIGPKSIKKQLQKNGILIIDHYIENIEEIYQLSDLYIFPVIAKSGSIGMPLSILEARACGIPVLTTEYGSIKEKLNSDSDNIFYSKPESFSKTLLEIKKKNTPTITNSIEKLNLEFFNVLYSSIN